MVTAWVMSHRHLWCWQHKTTKYIPGGIWQEPQAWYTLLHVLGLGAQDIHCHLLFYHITSQRTHKEKQSPHSGTAHQARTQPWAHTFLGTTSDSGEGWIFATVKHSLVIQGRCQKITPSNRKTQSLSRQKMPAKKEGIEAQSPELYEWMGNHRGDWPFFAGAPYSGQE